MIKKRIAVVSLFPEMFRAISESGITSRAIDNQLLDLVFVNPRDFTSDKHKTVDDRPYGGGPGMVMKVEPLEKALAHAFKCLDLVKENVTVIYFSPQGKLLNQQAVLNFVATEAVVDGSVVGRDEGSNESKGFNKGLILIAGRYEGIDERFIKTYVDEEWSIGDYVLSGGELPAMVFVDALIRQLPGALGDVQSAEQDSFMNGLLDCPHFTRPEIFNDEKVPAVLLSGDHQKIRDWRLQQSLGRTSERRPDLIEFRNLSAKERALLAAYKVTS